MLRAFSSSSSGFTKHAKVARDQWNCSSWSPTLLNETVFPRVVGWRVGVFVGENACTECHLTDDWSLDLGDNREMFSMGRVGAQERDVLHRWIHFVLHRRQVGETRNIYLWNITRWRSHALGGRFDVERWDFFVVLGRRYKINEEHYRLHVLGVTGDYQWWYFLNYFKQIVWNVKSLTLICFEVSSIWVMLKFLKNKMKQIWISTSKCMEIKSPMKLKNQKNKKKINIFR